MSNLVVDTLTNQDSQLCKAWVNFSGSGTVAIRASYNVSSITDLAVGVFGVNFTAAMSDANYSVVATSSYGETANADTTAWGGSSGADQTTSQVRCATRTSAGAFADPDYICVAVFR
tara:strand:- start:2167 stop:2517 length:351 start_codon:yes stop_codon:yes gene_type:complete